MNIIKDSIDRRLETSVITYNNTVLAISFMRGWTATFANSIEIRDYFTDQIIATWPWSGGFGCATVDENNIIHIFGSTNWTNNGNKVIHSTLDPATFQPSTPVDAMLPNAPFKFYNTDVTKYGNLWRATLEISANGSPAIYFAESPDLYTWTYKGGQLGAGGYVGCPSIHYIPSKSSFLLTYLKSVGGGRFATQAAKSADNCFTFTYFSGNANHPASEYFIAPEIQVDGKNASDVSMCEFNGKVYGVYLDGDQTSVARLKKFHFDGTMEQLYTEYFG